MTFKLLIAEDARDVADVVAFGARMTWPGCHVTIAADGAEALRSFADDPPDLVVLDVEMPKVNAFDVCQRMRATSQVPILMLTVRESTLDKVRALDLGADDYLTKPFETRELILRLSNILKRAAPVEPAEAPAAPEAIRFGPFSYRFDRGELRRGDELIRITDREREILTLLGQRAGANVAREELAGASGANERTVDVQITRLRRKIEADPANPAFLQTIRGIGYRLLVDQ